MTVRTKQLANANISSTAQQTLYTVPAGFRTILKEIDVLSGATAPGAFFLFIRTAAAVDAYLMWRNLTTLSVERWQGFAVLNAGDSLRCAIGSVTGGGYSVHAGGSELAL